MEDTSAEEQIFRWKTWDVAGEPGDMLFKGIRMRLKYFGLPPDDQIESVEWLPSRSKIIFHLQDGTAKEYGMKVSLFAI